MQLMHQWSLRLKMAPGLQPALVSLVKGSGSCCSSIWATICKVARLAARIAKTRRPSFCISCRRRRDLRTGTLQCREICIYVAKKFQHLCLGVYSLVTTITGCLKGTSCCDYICLPRRLRCNLGSFALICS